MNSPFT